VLSAKDAQARGGNEERRQQEVKKLNAGYTFDPHAGATYIFEHMPLASAEKRAGVAETPHIVEAINWTTTEGGGVHYNRYYAHDFDEALGLAVRLRIGFEEGVEEVVAIRPATRSEAAAGGAASAHFLELMPRAISSIDEKEGAQQAAARGAAKKRAKKR
jgi:hypothetical protein